jgi:glycosyltransferase involved in cell wall biosynthesis
MRATRQQPLPDPEVLGVSRQSAKIRLGAYAPSPRYDRAGLYRRIAADPRIEFTAVFSSSAGVRPGELGYGRPVSFDADALSGFTSLFLSKADRTEHDGSFTSLLDPDVVPEIMRRRFDVLWLHGYYSATHLMAAAAQIVRGGRLLVREEQTLLNPRPAWKRALKKPLLRLLFARSTGLFQGTANREWFGHYGMPDEKLFHVPLCVDNDGFRAEARRLAPLRTQLRDAFGIPLEAGPVILSVARLVPKKQPLILLDAFRRVRADHRCALLFVGTGECEDELRGFVERHAIPDVVFAGFINQSQISRAYAASDVFAASGCDETWGLAVNEAMNFGLPVVVSDKVGCAADLVAHGENGYVFRYARSDELAGYLALLVDDSSRREIFGRCATAMIAPWNYGAAAEGLLAAVRAAVGPRRWIEAEDRAHVVGGADAEGDGATSDDLRPELCDS